MRIARRYVINGRVQGVGFRFFVEHRAVLEGLHGWVANRPDGRVEILAEGDLESLERFDGHVRRGPRGARVDAVEVEQVPPSGNNSGFFIR